MASTVWGGTRNGDHHIGKAYEYAQLEAAGFEWPKRKSKSGPKTKQQQPRFNGGVTSPLEVRLQKGDKLFRFNPSDPGDLARQVRGHWWFDRDTCIYLWSRTD